jgi:glycosyltransferase involved in cell wall biosynthesis
MPLTVLSVGYPLAPVGPDSVGGAEQVLHAIDAALVEAGHRSIVLAAAGSTVRGEHLPLPLPKGNLDEPAQAAARETCARMLALAIRHARPDLVHLHGVDFGAYLPPPGVPVLVSLHLPLDFYPPAALRPARPETWLHPVSTAQGKTAPPGSTLLPAIPNGVPVDRLAGRHARRGFALAMGRVCPEKGFHLALDAARLAGTSLLLGGEVYPYPAHRAYFEREIRPRLDGRRRFLGPLTFARKRRLLGAARCLLVPSQAAETGSLVAMEAMAAGTPVIAFPAGALADVVEHGRTGLLVRTVAEMAEAIGAVGGIAAAACRDAARRRFSERVMTERYLELYARLCSGRVPALEASAA